MMTKNADSTKWTRTADKLPPFNTVILVWAYGEPWLAYLNHNDYANRNEWSFKNLVLYDEKFNDVKAWISIPALDVEIGE